MTDVTKYRNGEIVGRFQQEPTEEGEQVTPESYWTEGRRDRAIEQLRSITQSTESLSAI